MPFEEWPQFSTSSHLCLFNWPTAEPSSLSSQQLRVYLEEKQACYAPSSGWGIWTSTVFYSAKDSRTSHCFYAYTHSRMTLWQASPVQEGKNKFWLLPSEHMSSWNTVYHWAFTLHFWAVIQVFIPNVDKQFSSALVSWQRQTRVLRKTAADRDKNNYWSICFPKETLSPSPQAALLNTSSFTILFCSRTQHI